MKQSTTLALLLLGSALAACSDGGGTYPIEDVKEIADPEPPFPATSAQRFGFGSGGGDPHGQGGGATQQPAAGSAGLDFAMPEGWHELPPTDMRRLNLSVAGRDDAECYLSALPGSAGGALANINRWLGQVGLEPIDAAALEALPTKSFFGFEAYYLDVEGDYTGMGGVARPETALVGLVLEAGESMVFLKMVGPADVIAGERARFELLAGSLRPKGMSAPPADTGAGAPMTSSGGGSGGGLVWDVPEGWSEAAPRQMRVVTLLPDGASDTECYVTRLPGGAGGVLANINRWRGQLGLSPLSDDDLAGLERRPMLDAEGVVVDLAGDFKGMSGSSVEGAGLLGLLCLLPDSMVFVKMTGPREEVDAQRERFFDFCGSLAYEGS